MSLAIDLDGTAGHAVAMRFRRVALAVATMHLGLVTLAGLAGCSGALPPRALGAAAAPPASSPPDTLPPPAPAAPPAPATPPALVTDRVEVRVLALRLCVPPEYDPSHHIVGVEVDVKNVSSIALVLVAASAMLIDGEGRQYRRMSVNPVGVSGQLDVCEPELTGLPARPLPPGEKQRGFIDVFMVPLDAKDFRVRFETFTEAEWHGPGGDARPVAIEVPVGSLDERSAWRPPDGGSSDLRELLLPTRK